MCSKHGSADADFGLAAASLRRGGKSALEGRRVALPVMYQLHDGVSDLLLSHGGGPRNHRRQHEPAGSAMGFLFLSRACAHSRDKLSPAYKRTVPAMADA